MILSLKVKMAKWALPVFWTFHQPNQALRGKGWRRPEWLVSIPDPGFLSWVGWGENGKEGQEVWVTLEVEFRNKGTQSVTTTYFSAPDWYGLECVICPGLSCFLSDAERKAAFTKVKDGLFSLSGKLRWSLYLGQKLTSLWFTLRKMSDEVKILV